MRLPFVISIPHCSYLIPQEILPSVALTDREIQQYTDMGTREVFAHLPVRYALWGRWNRIVVDLNRDHRQGGPRGVLPSVDYYGREVYKRGCVPDETEVERRLNTYYWPYHNRLREATEDPEVKILFDCHSLTRIGPPEAPDHLKWRKDIVLGNNGDSQGRPNPFPGPITCPPDFIRMMKGVFEKSGFSVSINKPYSGGFITSHYGAHLVKQGKMAVQIEINEDLYMDPEGMRIQRDTLSELAVKLQGVFRGIARDL